MFYAKLRHNFDGIVWQLLVWIELVVWGLTITMSRYDLDLPQIIHFLKLISPRHISMLPFTSNHLSLFFDFCANNPCWTSTFTSNTFFKRLFIDCFVPIKMFVSLFRLVSFLLSEVLELLLWLATLALLWFFQITVDILGLESLNST